MSVDEYIDILLNSTTEDFEEILDRCNIDIRARPKRS